MKISIFGLGGLGAPMLAVYARAGHEVTGMDLNPAVVAAINAHNAPFFEPFLQTELSNHTAHYRAVDSVAEAVLHSEMGFVIVPTPSTPRGDFDIDAVLETVTGIGAVLKDHADHAFRVVIVSTVNPGDMVKIAVALGNAARRNTPIPLFYSPEFIRLGEVVKDLRNPDRILIGTQEPADVLVSFYRSISPSSPIFVLSWSEAEVVKLAANVFLTAKIVLTNEITQLAARLGADAVKVLQTIGMDHRINAHLMKPGPAVGGPCLPRDALALHTAAGRVNLSLPIIGAVTESNRAWKRRLADWLIDAVRGPIVGMVGVAYKDKTGRREESFAEYAMHVLRGYVGEVVFFDDYVNSICDYRRLEWDQLWRECQTVIVSHPSYYDRIPAERGGILLIDLWGAYRDTNPPLTYWGDHNGPHN